MKTGFSTVGLARLSARRPWLVIVGWLAIVIVAGVALTPLLRTTTDANFTNKPESAKGSDLIEQRLRKDEPLTETVIVRSANATVDDAAFQSKMNQIATDLSARDYVVSTTDYYSVAQSTTPMTMPTRTWQRCKVSAAVGLMCTQWAPRPATTSSTPSLKTT